MQALQPLTNRIGLRHLAAAAPAPKEGYSGFSWALRQQGASSGPRAQLKGSDPFSPNTDHGW